MENRPRCIENIKTICEGLNLVRIIKRHDYMKPEDLDIVLKTMYPHAQYNEQVPVRHGCKTWYKNAIWDSIPAGTRFSVTTVNKLVGPIYNFDIANPEYIEPNSLSLEELIPSLAEFVTNRKYPANNETELVSTGKPIKLHHLEFTDQMNIMLSIIKLLSYNNTALHDAIRAYSTSYRDMYEYISRTWDSFYQDPNFTHISREKTIWRCTCISGSISIIYAKLLQDRESMVQDREINITAIQERLNTILISEGHEPTSVESAGIAQVTEPIVNPESVN